MNDRDNNESTTIERAMQAREDSQHPAISSSPGLVSPPGLAASFAPRSWEELKEISAMLAGSNIAPAAYKGKPNDALVAILMGLELGLNPATALQNIGVVEGTPAPYGSIVLALARRSPGWDERAYQEWFELNGQKVEDPYELDADPNKWPVELRAVCVVRRHGGHPRKESFSVARAMQAGLWMRKSAQGKPMPWSMYPADMLMWKARARAIRPTFPDVLKGCPVYEDLSEQRREERVVNDTRPGEDRSPPPAALSHSEAVLQKGEEQQHYLQQVSEAMEKAKDEAALKAISQTPSWKELNNSHRKEARSRYALRLSELREAEALNKGKGGVT